MFKICYAEFPEPMEDGKFNLYLEQVPAEIQKHVLKYRKWQDQHMSLFGKLLIVKGFEVLGKQVRLSDLKNNPFGKPYFDNQPEFNLSNTGTLVVCAFADLGKVGLDVEEIVEEDYNVFKGSFTAAEWIAIESAGDPLKQFYTTWTIKEAVIKAIGKGLSIPLKSISISNNNSTVKLGGENWYYKKVDYPGAYTMHIASDHPIELMELVRIEF
jgi:4'-phosphopantetheinyl transferase